MTKDEIKLIVRRYRNISILWLGAFLLFAITANWFLVSNSIDRYFELGLDYVSGQQGYVWGAIIGGLYIVLYLAFYSIEKILLAMHEYK